MKGTDRRVGRVGQNLKKMGEQQYRGCLHKIEGLGQDPLPTMHMYNYSFYQVAGIKKHNTKNLDLQSLACSTHLIQARIRFC